MLQVFNKRYDLPIKKDQALINLQAVPIQGLRFNRIIGGFFDGSMHSVVDIDRFFEASYQITFKLEV